MVQPGGTARLRSGPSESRCHACQRLGQTPQLCGGVALAPRGGRSALCARLLQPRHSLYGGERCAPGQRRSLPLVSERRRGRRQQRTDKSPTELRRASKPITVFNQKNNRYYQVYQDGGNLYQSAYELDKNGHKIYSIAHKIDYVSGGESVGYTYIY